MSEQIAKCVKLEIIDGKSINVSTKPITNRDELRIIDSRSKNISTKGSSANCINSTEFKRVQMQLLDASVRGNNYALEKLAKNLADYW